MDRSIVSYAKPESTEDLRHRETLVLGLETAKLLSYTEHNAKIAELEQSIKDISAEQVAEDHSQGLVARLTCLSRRNSTRTTQRLPRPLLLLRLGMMSLLQSAHVRKRQPQPAQARSHGPGERGKACVHVENCVMCNLYSLSLIWYSASVVFLLKHGAQLQRDCSPARRVTATRMLPTSTPLKSRSLTSVATEELHFEEYNAGQRGICASPVGRTQRAARCCHQRPVNREERS